MIAEAGLAALWLAAALAILQLFLDNLQAYRAGSAMRNVADLAAGY